MATRQHRSFRFAPGVLERLARRAADTGVSVTALVERYVEEGLRHDDHPRIVFLDGPAGRRASIAGSGLDVWEVVETVIDNNGSVEEAAAYLSISEVHVRNALAYYAEFSDEIDEWIAANERYAELHEQAVRRVADALA